MISASTLKASAASTAISESICWFMVTIVPSVNIFLMTSIDFTPSLSAKSLIVMTSGIRTLRRGPEGASVVEAVTGAAIGGGVAAAGAVGAGVDGVALGVGRAVVGFGGGGVGNLYVAVGSLRGASFLGFSVT